MRSLNSNMKWRADVVRNYPSFVAATRQPSPQRRPLDGENPPSTRTSSFNTWSGTRHYCGNEIREDRVCVIYESQIFKGAVMSLFQAPEAQFVAA